MNEKYHELINESEEEWAEIQKNTATRKKKDERIISMFCAENPASDINRTLELLEQYEGMPDHDKKIIKKFKDEYPKELSLSSILGFLDTTDIYHKYLESGGGAND